MITDLLFVAAFSFLLTHEMDAVRRHEWRLLPFLSRLNDDERAHELFTALHVPLYIALLWVFFGRGVASAVPLVVGLDLFCIVHVGLHVLLRNHPNYHFRSLLSWGLIAGAGVAGGLDLLFRL